MHAIVQDKYGSPDALQLREIATPSIGDDQVLVRVRAASVHFGDVHFMTGTPYLMRYIGFGLHGPKARVRAYAYHAVDPAGQLLIGPAYAIPQALDRAGVSLADIDVVEMHEAFAAQVLSTLQKLESAAFAQQELGRSAAVGRLDPERVNRLGGSIALGHPFGATGARCVTTLANELERQSAALGLVSVCAAGGVGAAIVLERV